MQERILRKLFLGFIQVHILYHAAQAPIYGAWLIDELASHGYALSPGTLYPILKQMLSMELLTQEMATVSGKRRKYYHITPTGKTALAEAKKRVQLMHEEINQDHDIF
ncbi:MAG: PadR family transcriptional regulator, regulatory protein PadR [Clostridiales bacterium]|jgi:DNA-binding PadR family transcriptional regulator|nr:PadR family transcriptional regulator, regulatory protein PadR [Clostridiales bacterium]MDN5299722.1 PadR family transcriptional regulator, regulatory protein PadR [Clostridiales bacterium]